LSDLEQPWVSEMSTLAGAVVLAGGQSRRMGQDKALLRLQGEALLTRTCRLARAVSDRVWVITTRSEYQSLFPQGCELILETDPQGPLIAFSQALKHLGLGPLQQDGWVLLLACDLPLLTAEDLARAIVHLLDLPATVDAYLPPAVIGRQPDRQSDAKSDNSRLAKQIQWEPLCGFYRQRCLGSLQATISQRGTRSFQRWLLELNVAPLTAWPTAHLLNCNRPEDWHRVLNWMGEP